MQRPTRVSRYPVGAVAGSVLVISTLVLPLLELLTGAFGSPLWTFLAFFVLGVGLIAALWVPWLLTAPVRKLRRKYIAGNPDALVSIIGTWDDEGVELGVIAADAEAITFQAVRLGRRVVVPWSSIDAITVVKSETYPAEQIELVTCGPLGAIRFSPVRANGHQMLVEWRLPQFATDLRNKRLRTDAR